MAKTTTQLYTDDLDGTPAAETVAFTLDDVRYEIDLSGENAGVFREVLQPWREAARRVTPRRQAPRNQVHREHSAAIRAWALASGIDVKDHGRIPDDVVRRYENRQHHSAAA